MKMGIYLVSMSIGDIERWSTSGMIELRISLGLFSQSFKLIQ